MESQGIGGAWPFGGLARVVVESILGGAGYITGAYQLAQQLA